MTEDIGLWPEPVRRRLPGERQGVVHKIDVAGFEVFLRTGEYEDGKLGEIFIEMAKEGSTLSGFADCFATVVSIALQHGVPLRDIASKMIHTRFEPNGWTSNEKIGLTSSVLDYVFRFLLLRYDPEALTELRKEKENGEPRISAP